MYANKYCFVRYREDVTGISEATLVSNEFDTLGEAQIFHQENPHIFEVENPYFVHVAEKTPQGDYYLLSDRQQIWIL
jgi:hypothetical protein